MSGLHLQEFIALLKKSELLSTQQWENVSAITKSAREGATEEQHQGGHVARLVATELVRQGLLTEWQASQLLKSQTGFVLQQYRLLAPVGKGGMGHVFKARDGRSGAIVAIKVMSRHLTFNQALVNRFRREIKASSLLNSPHVVRTLDAGRVGKVDFMVMEFVNGDQLDRVASRLTAMPASLACEVVRQAALGLQHAHEHKMVHRDIKPANLIVDWSAEGAGTVKIMDMGLVRLNDDGEEQTTMTKAGQVMGTPDYMSPEQGWNTASVDIRSDIYSLGCTLFRLLTGRIPFPGDNPLQVLMARCSRDMPAARSLRSEIPEEVDAVVRRMTRRDPAARFQTPQELIDALIPLCSPLTMDALKSAVRASGHDDAVLLEAVPVREADFAQDAGYQQFLREVTSGADVNLMTATSSGEAIALESTLPVLKAVTNPVLAERRASQRPNRTASTITLGAGSALAVLVALFLWLNRDQGAESNDDSSDATNSTSEASLPEVQFVPSAAMELRAGETLTWQPEFAGTKPVVTQGDEFKFRLGSGHPAFAKIDEATGAVTWNIPREQTPEDYSIPIEYTLMREGRVFVLANMTLPVTVTTIRPSITLNRPDPVHVMAGKEVSTTLNATPPLTADGAWSLRLGGNATPEMRLDAKSGEFFWKPTEDDAGPNAIGIQLVDDVSGVVVAEVQLPIIVISIPIIPEQSARAGEVFTLAIPRARRALNGSYLPLRIVPGGPPGATFNQRLGEVRWPVPTDTTGRHEIRLRLDDQIRLRRPRDFEVPELVIVVNVSGGNSPVATVTNTRPDPKNVETAKAELRELFKRELAAARTPTERAALARTLLERSYDQDHGASDFAALDIVLEQANRGRALDVALDAVQLRAQRYGTDEREEAAEYVSEFRLASLLPTQYDAAIEQCVRLARDAAEAQEFTEVAALLSPAEAILKKVDRSPLVEEFADDLEHAAELAKELSDDDAKIADSKTKELSRLLARWQFQSLFTDVNSFSYIEATLPGGARRPDSGRSLWTVDVDRVRLSADGGQSSFGILDATQAPGRAIVRMQLSARSTTTVFMFGAVLNQSLSAAATVLDSSSFGLVRDLPSLNVIHQPTQPITMPTEGWNDVEVAIDGTRLTIRLNGANAVAAQLPIARGGRMGLFAALDRNLPEHVLDVRRARVLVLPD